MELERVAITASFGTNEPLNNDEQDSLVPLIQKQRSLINTFMIPAPKHAGGKQIVCFSVLSHIGEY